MITTLRNLPIARLDRTTAFAYSMNRFGSTRMDSVYVLGCSSRGIGFVGKTLIVNNDKCMVHRLPVEEYWETDLQLPPTAEIGLGGLGQTAEICGWFHQRFSKKIMEKINSAIKSANQPVPSVVNLRMVGTNDCQPHAVIEFMRECGKELTKEEENGAKPPMSSNDMAVAMAMWQTYSRELCVYSDDMPKRNILTQLVLEAYSLSFGVPPEEEKL